MDLTRRSLLAGAGGGFWHALHADSTVPTPAEVHRELVRGNLRFLAGHPKHPHSSPSWVRKTGREGQHPHAIVLCCSDSRVVPEIVFDQGLGDLFTVRVAGNVANEDEIASIQYANRHFHIPLAVVMGHSRCGAISAVVEEEDLPERLNHLAAPIRKAYDEERQRLPAASKAELLEATIRANVVRCVSDLANEPEIQEALRKGKFRIEGAVYSVDTARVSWL
jgi:carbonic anhydrase